MAIDDTRKDEYIRILKYYLDFQNVDYQEN
jgi:hypothetical protein